MNEKTLEIVILAGICLVSSALVILLNLLTHCLTKDQDPASKLRKYSLAPKPKVDKVSRGSDCQRP